MAADSRAPARLSPGFPLASSPAAPFIATIAPRPRPSPPRAPPITNWPHPRSRPASPGKSLAGLTLQPGVFNYSAAAAFTSGVLTLDGLNQSNPLFVIQIGSTLISTGTVSFNFINGAGANNLWFQVGTSTTLGIGASFAGTIIADVSDTLNTGVSLNGRVFALTGAATLDTNQITGISAIPEPSTYAAIAAGLALIFAVAHRRRSLV